MPVSSWVLAAAVAASTAVAAFFNPVVLAAPVVLLVWPAMKRWERLGVLADVSAWQTHPAALGAAQTAGTLAGFWLAGRHLAGRQTDLGWLVVVLALCAAAALQVVAFRASTRRRDTICAGRAAAAAAAVLLCGYVAWLVALTWQDYPMASRAAAAVLMGNTAAGVWTLAALLPRPLRRSRQRLPEPSA